jgi:hypothetical protein
MACGLWDTRTAVCHELCSTALADGQAVVASALPYCPGQQVFAAQNNDANAVATQQLLGPCETPFIFAKHMGKHRLGLRSELFRSPRAKHVVGTLAT